MVDNSNAQGTLVRINFQPSSVWRSGIAMAAIDKVLNGEVWEEFCDALKVAGKDILNNSAADELERAEGFRYLARLTGNSLSSGIDPVPLVPPVIRYQTTRIGANNPDFLYGACRIRGSAVYRIRGRKNDADNFNIGAYHGRLGTPEGLQSSGFLALSEMETNQDGSFEIIASREKRSGNWLELCAKSNQFMVRQTILNPGKDTPAELTIDIIDGELQSPAKPLSADTLENSLGMSALMVHGIVKQFIGWTNDFKQRPNEIHPIKPELLGFAKGDPNTQYNYAYFDLAEDEALVVELRPPECEYWNIQLANHWLESLDNPDIPSSINHSNAQASGEGVVNVVISRHDPGVPNWLDTQGHLRGTIALRWVGVEPQPDPKVTRCNIAQLRKDS